MHVHVNSLEVVCVAGWMCMCGWVGLYEWLGVWREVN